MRVLELVRSRSPILRACFEQQVLELQRKGAEVVSVDLSKVLPKDIEGSFFNSLRSVSFTPDVVLLRGASIVNYVVDALPSTPVFVDHVEPLELGISSPIRRGLKKAKKVICYSILAEDELRHMTIRPVLFPGPYLSLEFVPPPETKFVCVLDSDSQAFQILVQLLRAKSDRKWDLEITTTMKHQDVWEVDFDFEAVEGSHIVVVPTEDKDFGQPHEGAILAQALGRYLVTCSNSALKTMGFPQKQFMPAVKRAFGSYASCVQHLIVRDLVVEPPQERVENEIVELILRG